MKKHKTIPLSTRQSITNYGNSLQLSDPKDVDMPSRDIMSIAELTLLWGSRREWKTRVNEFEVCRHSRITEGLMKIYCREIHE
jgi:hypothetical protein